MPAIVRYNVKDIETKRVYPNLTAQDITDNFGISRRWVTECAKKGFMAKGKYKIETIDISKYVDEKNKNIPISMLEKWDKICKPLNKVLRENGISIKLTCCEVVRKEI